MRDRGHDRPHQIPSAARDTGRILTGKESPSPAASLEKESLKEGGDEEKVDAKNFSTISERGWKGKGITFTYSKGFYSEGNTELFEDE